MDNTSVVISVAIIVLVTVGMTVWGVDKNTGDDRKETATSSQPAQDENATSQLVSMARIFIYSYNIT